MQQKKNDMEKQLEVAEVEAATVKNDLKLAMKRIEDLQTAITGELDSESYSDPGSDSSDEDLAVSTRYLLAPTGALIVLMCYYSITSARRRPLFEILSISANIAIMNDVL